ncbi:uncharacterized protein [Apteryx mantelli]|uniref:Uncharacterized protein n=1 Tax=Apteryx mantelli TaxID=2696672 RepID=A0ABM4FTV6_9AVES
MVRAACSAGDGARRKHRASSVQRGRRGRRSVIPATCRAEDGAWCKRRAKQAASRSRGHDGRAGRPEAGRELGGLVRPAPRALAARSGRGSAPRARSPVEGTCLLPRWPCREPWRCRHEGRPGASAAAGQPWAFKQHESDPQNNTPRACSPAARAASSLVARRANFKADNATPAAKAFANLAITWRFSCSLPWGKTPNKTPAQPGFALRFSLRGEAGGGGEICRPSSRFARGRRVLVSVRAAGCPRLCADAAPVYLSHKSLGIIKAALKGRTHFCSWGNWRDARRAGAPGAVDPNRKFRHNLRNVRKHQEEARSFQARFSRAAVIALCPRQISSSA